MTSDIEVKRQNIRELLMAQNGLSKTIKIASRRAAGIKVFHGDVWRLGRHRLRCGDSTRLSPILATDFVFTGPPFDFDYDIVFDIIERSGAASWVVMGPFIRVAKIAAKKEFLFLQDWVWAFGMASSHGNKDKANHKTHFIVAHGGKPNWSRSNTGVGFSLSQQTRWCPSLIYAPKDVLAGHGHAKNLFQTTNFLRGFSGDVVFDPFSGSGTVLLACEACGKTCDAIDIVPENCELIIMRWMMARRNRAEKPELICREETLAESVPLSGQRPASKIQRRHACEPGR